jgi:hypothetical protein
MDQTANVGTHVSSFVTSSRQGLVRGGVVTQALDSTNHNEKCSQ